jgi:hypothetical protein
MRASLEAAALELWSALQQLELLGCWPVEYQARLLMDLPQLPLRCEMPDLEPFSHLLPWTAALQGLRVAPQAMADNLERAGGFVYAETVTIALADTLGRPAAKALMERLCADSLARGCPLPRALEDAVAADPVLAAALPPARRARLFDPATQLGDADAMIDQALNAWRDARARA